MVGSYPSEYCGISEYAKGLINALEEGGTTITVCRVYFRRDPLNLLQWFHVLATLLQQAFHAVHFQYTPTIVGPLAPFLILAAKAWGRGARVVVTSHEGFVIYARRFRAPLKGLFYLYERIIYHLADTVIVHDEEHRTELQYRYDLPATRVVSHAMPTADRGSRTHDLKPLRTKYGIHSNVVVLFFGLITKRKGLSTLVAAFEQYARRQEDAQLVIAGKVIDPGVIPVQQAPDRPGGRMRRSVVVTGPVSEAEVDALMSLATVLVLPYQYATHSIVLVRAVQNRIPVIATEAGAIARTVRKWKLGLTVPLNDTTILAKAIEELCRNTDLRETVLQNQRRYQDENSWSALVARYAPMYRNGG